MANSTRRGRNHTLLQVAPPDLAPRFHYCEGDSQRVAMLRQMLNWYTYLSQGMLPAKNSWVATIEPGMN